MLSRITHEPHLGYWILALVALHRATEVVVDARNARQLVERGAIVVPHAGTAPLIAFHLAWFAGIAAERHLLAARMFSGRVTASLAGALLAAELVRAWVLATLGRRWTMRVVVAPGEEPVAAGPYRLARHPNYAVVVVEVLLVPLLLGAWRTAIAGSLAHLPVLALRIRREEEAWEHISGVRPSRVPARRGGNRATGA